MAKHTTAWVKFRNFHFTKFNNHEIKYNLFKYSYKLKLVKF